MQRNIRNWNLELIVFLAVFLLYIIFYILDELYPYYLGVKSIYSLIEFSYNKTLFPSPPKFSDGWHYYFGTSIFGINLLPAMLATLKLDLTLTFSSVFLALLIGFIISFPGYYLRNRIYSKIIGLFNLSLFSMPYMVFILILMYIIRPSIYGIIIGAGISWFPFYIRRLINLKRPEGNLIYLIKYVFKKLIPYIFSDIGTMYAIINLILFFGIYTSNFLLVNLGTLMYINGNGITYLSIGMWWVEMFPVIFLSLFVLSAHGLGYGIRRSGIYGKE
ncbi:hypothetical protein [Acidiplasma sp.]|uniref:hypothetical protein n=1 Tax=Acidiplasma sp. TaxID=1872114 RepID=UPI0031643D5C